MADVFTQQKRSSIMRAVRGKDTQPELIVRRQVHSMGFRYRLHVHTLPGCPDIVLPLLRKVIFVHGCFWHLHQCRRGKRTPVNNAEYWQKKREGNRARDRRTTATLKREGWSVLVIWECSIHTGDRLRARLSRFLDASEVGE